MTERIPWLHFPNLPKRGAEEAREEAQGTNYHETDIMHLAQQEGIREGREMLARIRSAGSSARKLKALRGEMLRDWEGRRTGGRRKE